MPKITMTRDWKNRAAGETWNASEKVAEQLISGGFAQAVESAQPLDEERAPEPETKSDDGSETVETLLDPESHPPRVSEPETSSEQQVQSENPNPVPRRHARHRSWIRIH